MIDARKHWPVAKRAHGGNVSSRSLEVNMKITDRYGTVLRCYDNGGAVLIVIRFCRLAGRWIT